MVLERIAEHHDVTRVLGADTITRVPPVWLSLEILRLLVELQDRRRAFASPQEAAVRR